MTDDFFDEWTPEERARLAEVGQHRSPRSELKGRTLLALREHDLLGAVELPRPRQHLAFALPAALAIFAVGMLTGYAVGLRRQGETTVGGRSGPQRPPAGPRKPPMKMCCAPVVAREISAPPTTPRGTSCSVGV